MWLRTHQSAPFTVHQLANAVHIITFSVMFLFGFLVPSHPALFPHAHTRLCGLRRDCECRVSDESDRATSRHSSILNISEVNIQLVVGASAVSQHTSQTHDSIRALFECAYCAAL